jgi:NAD(P)H-hydrate repair Nnr-like enzyme with NAD(P)H-hydrate dehydratase domain
MGHPLRFDYHVRLGPRREGYLIEAQRCAPAAEDTGHTRMCAYAGMGDTLTDIVAADSPLCGERLDAVIGWTRLSSSAGCYCDEASRVHKWGLVLETIHYALASSEPVRITDS